MPPVDFANLAASAFDQIKCALSVEALYMPKTGGQTSIRGPFDDRAQEVDPDTDIVISSNIFTFGLKLSDLSLPPEKGDKLRINEKNYVVIDVQEDGVEGVSVVLFLHKVVTS
jgi:hypothetical protein